MGIYISNKNIIRLIEPFSEMINYSFSGFFRSSPQGLDLRVAVSVHVKGIKQANDNNRLTSPGITSHSPQLERLWTEF